MAVLSAVFWCIEGAPVLREIKRVRSREAPANPLRAGTHSMCVVSGMVRALFKGWPLAVDIFVTVWLTGAFGMTGLMGSIIGLSVSNVISVFLLLNR